MRREYRGGVSKEGRCMVGGEVEEWGVDGMVEGRISIGEYRR